MVRRDRSSGAVVTLPALTPGARRALRARLPRLIDEAAAAVSLAASIVALDPEGALYHLLLAGDTASRARALARARR